MACEVAFASEVGQLILFHHDPSYSDAMVAGMEATAKDSLPRPEPPSKDWKLHLREELKIAKRLHSPSAPAPFPPEE